MPTRRISKAPNTARKLNTKAMSRHAAAAASYLKALANEQRLAILCTLLGGPRSVGQINDQVHLSQSALSQHLAVLREQGLVSTDKQAQTVYYSVSDEKTHELIGLLHDHFCKP